MKIALIGTHGTGKTALAHELVAMMKKQSIHADFLGELARQNPMPINEGATKESQEWLMYNQYVKELEMQNKCDVLICDRSILDCYVYYYNIHGRDRLLETIARENSEKYKALIKVPINPEYLKDDGIRSTDPRWQKEIDDNFNYLLEKFNIPYNQYETLEKIVDLVR